MGSFFKKEAADIRGAWICTASDAAERVPKDAMVCTRTQLISASDGSAAEIVVVIVA